MSASDGSLDASDTFRLTITPVNDAPVVGTAIDEPVDLRRYGLDLPGSRGKRSRTWTAIA